MLDLVATATRALDSDLEVVALVTELIDSGRVMLSGSFAGERLSPRQ